MSDDAVKHTARSKIGKTASVSNGRAIAQDSQGVQRPAYLRQPDVIALPTVVPQRQDNSKPVASQSVVNNNSSSKGE
jgi:hypothetical protein